MERSSGSAEPHGKVTPELCKNLVMSSQGDGLPNHAPGSPRMVINLRGLKKLSDPDMTVESYLIRKKQVGEMAY